MKYGLGISVIFVSCCQDDVWAKNQTEDRGVVESIFCILIVLKTAVLVDKCLLDDGRFSK